MEAELPEGVTAHERCGDGKKYLFVENYSDASVNVRLDYVYTDVVSGETVSDTIGLSAYGGCILEREE